MGLTITIAGSPVSFVEKSLKVSAKVNQRSSCTFTVLDTSGTAVFRKGQSVVVSDSVLGVLYAGFVNKPKVKNLYPNRHNLWTIDCVDMIWLADKRSSNSLYVNQYAGTIVCDQVQRILASEGVWGNFALGYHHQLTDWANTQVYGSDTFARSNQTGLGTASDTQVWAKIGTGTMTAAISGNEGTLTGAASSDTIYQLGSKAIADAEAVFRFKVTNTANDIIGPALRIQDANNWYRARLFNGNLTLVKMVTGVVSTFGQVAFAATNATFYWMRYRIVGPNHYLKAWADGTTEPVDWNVTAADSSIMVTGGFGLEGWSSSSMDVLTFDSLTVQAAGNTIATTTNGDGNPGDGDLELAPAGLAVAKSESTTSDWNTNLSMTGLDATGNMLQLASHATLAFEGVNGGNYGSSFGNAFAYQQIWNGSYTIVAGDVLQYSVWISSSSPQIMAGVDVIFSDGSTLRDSGAVDQNGINAHPNADLVGFANDQWYTRTIWLGSRVGKTTQLATLGFEGDNAGQYTAYFRDITIVNGSTTKATLYQGATPHAAIIQPQSNVKIAANGYSNVTVIPVIGYESSGTRSANATSLTDVGLYQSSTINWTEVIPTTAVGSTTAVGTITINTSIDGGATWQPATLNTPIAHLVAGASLVGQTLQTQQILTLTAKDPTASPSLALVSWSVLPSYVASKSDIRASYTTAADWASGTLTNLTSANQNLTINSSLRNWDDASIANQTLFGSASPVQGTYKKQGTLTSSTGADVRARLDFAGNWQNFTMSVDLQITSANQWSGLVYRTTGWVNGNDTYAYKADVNLTGIFLGKATNGGASSRTALGSAVLSLTAGDWHTLTVTVNGSQHQVYLDGVLYINVVDSTYTATGQIGIVLNNFTGSTQTASFDNFGVMPVAAITPNTPLPQWVSASIALGSLTVGASIIQWNAAQPNGSIVNVLASVNGGTYTACTNGAAIPGLTAGTVLTSGTVQLQVQLQAAQASAAPMVSGLTAWVLSQFNATGNRVSTVLSLTPVGRVGNSLVAWNANLPTGTTLGVDVSPDASTWTDVSSGNGSPIPYYTMQPDPYVDAFPIDSHANFTATFLSGGAAGTWTWDTANARVVGSGGTNAVETYDALSFSDGYVESDLDYADVAGIGLRWTGASNSYYLKIRDDSSSTGGPSQTIQLFKVVSGTKTQIGANVSISFVRGTPHRVHFEAVGTTLSVWWDGVVVLTATDSSISGPGKAFFYESSKGQFYSLRVQPYGQDLTGLNIYYRLRLASTDPTVTPQVLDATVAAYSPNITVGALIPSTQYSVKQSNSQNSIAVSLDDIAQKSVNVWWKIDKNKTFFFQKRTGTPALFPLATVNGDILMQNLQITNSSPSYRNTGYVVGGTDQKTDTKVFTGDGITQSWSLPYPVAASTSGVPNPPVITVNGLSQTVGIQGTNTGMSFYYQVGSNVITRDATLIPLDKTQAMKVVYPAQITARSSYADNAEIAAYAAIEGGSGIVEVVESFPGYLKATTDVLVVARVQQNEVRGRTFKLVTQRVGFASGQIVPVFCSQLGLQNAQLLCSQVDTQFIEQAGGTTPWLTVTLLEGPSVGDWTRFYASGMKR
jgi:hypothetical protein